MVWPTLAIVWIVLACIALLCALVVFAFGQTEDMANGPAPHKEPPPDA